MITYKEQREVGKYRTDCGKEYNTDYNIDWIRSSTWQSKWESKLCPLSLCWVLTVLIMRLVIMPWFVVKIHLLFQFILFQSRLSDCEVSSYHDDSWFLTSSSRWVWSKTWWCFHIIYNINTVWIIYLFINMSVSKSFHNYLQPETILLL